MRVTLQAGSYLGALGIVAGATAVASVVVWFAPLDSVSAIYMLPVLISAVRFGTGPAVFAALLGAFMTSLFYPPLFSPLVFQPAQVTDLVTSLLVALTVGRLAGRLRAQMLRATTSEQTIRQVYELGGALAGATDVEAVYGFLADHVGQALQRPVAVFMASDGRRPVLVRGRNDEASSAELSSRVSAFLDDPARTATAVANMGTDAWLLCRIAAGSDSSQAVLAVDLQSTSGDAFDMAVARADALLAEASRSLERLGLSRVLEERRLRQRTDALRDILVESVSHELRTPLAGIMGAASVLATAPGLSGDAALAGLAGSIEQEARRLDRLIQEVLDLGRIRAGALQPRLDTVDPCDIVEAAVRAAADRLRGHVVRNALDPSLPPVRVDPTLVAQALVNVLENAAKYTEAGHAIDVAAEERDGTLAIIVRDEGAGLAAGEADLIFERFRRGSRHADVVGGSGLGLTIARVFVEACGGRVVAQSDGPGRGTSFRLVLRIAEVGHGEHDED